ncbi:hypothetical protein TUM4438_41300 [Shewanella sairae]|uniref:Large polyvalent protein associated domain-containing protein n=1 Tax=Shewanella sairae TaxID=190310 RepID=A0ABQ4PQU7_9GAMM|nr:DUF3560 domain-containing protein [Shewanella sairae]MCL1132335.1 DUF3560 domain-containing protein [Shewanella sairae]GIU51492.1 hypothetical protein TUM4438_41300 [Shewanella sairae]
MTNSIPAQATHTNTHQVAVSLKTQAGSPKPDILKSLKAGKLRKNAKNKIAALLEVATGIVLHTQSMGLDDCYDYNAPKSIDVAGFWVWYEKKYRDLEIYVTVTNGVVSSVRFSDCPYHFSHDVVLTFGEIEADIVEAQPEAAPVVLTKLSSFDTSALEPIAIEVIEIVWSESNQFKDGEKLSLSEYNQKSTIEALEIGRGQGYAKTKIIIHKANGETLEHRHDIDANYPTLTVDLASCGLSATQADTKPFVKYEQVKQALAAGYISPLNHAEKAPEPTPPSDNENSRKVVSLGDYQERIESKRERLEERANKAAAESDRYYSASKSLASLIPFGQPILVGHHSEKRARRHADKIFNDMGKSVAASEKADYLAGKAASIGSNGIASDDPEAITKLKAKLAGLERAQETMKAINKVVRSKHMSDADKIEYMEQSHQLTNRQAQELLKGDFCGRVGFASYQLSNNNATITTTKQRIADLETLHNQKPLAVKGCIDGLAWELFEEDGRIKITFDDKPSEEIRNLIKNYAFKWSRYSTAWVRKITPNAIASARRLLTQLATN